MRKVMSSGVATWLPGMRGLQGAHVRRVRRSPRVALATLLHGVVATARSHRLRGEPFIDGNALTVQGRSGLLTVLGLTAGLVCGFLGIGGGLVLVPALMLFFRYPIKRAVGTSLATVVIVALAAVVSELVVKGSNIRWTVGLVLIGGALLGSSQGARLLAHMTDGVLRVGFAGVLVVAAYRMAVVLLASGDLGPLRLTDHSMAGYAGILAIGVVAGCASVLFGIGGGLVVVPGLALLFGDMSFHAARATALVTILPTAAFGAYQHRAMGNVDAPVARRLIPAGLMGAGIGVVGANLLPAGPCHLVFAAFLVVAAIRLVAADAGAWLGVTKQRLKILIRPIALLGLVALSGPATAGDLRGRVADSDWHVLLRTVEEALARHDISTAERAWHDAYVAALHSRERWEGMLEVGDATLRIGEAANSRTTAEPQARSAYLSALLRARRQRSVEGVLRTGDAFAALGDRPMAEGCVHVAEQLAAAQTDPRAHDHLRALRARLAGEAVLARRVWEEPAPPLILDAHAGP